MLRYWNEFSTPALYPWMYRYAEDGTDGLDGNCDGGAGVEFVFTRWYPGRYGSQDGSAFISTTPGQDPFIQDDFVPSGWTDDPVGPDDTFTHEWVAARVGSTGLWGEFSVPSLWALFAQGEPGLPGSDGKSVFPYYSDAPEYIIGYRSSTHNPKLKRYMEYNQRVLLVSRPK